MNPEIGSLLNQALEALRNSNLETAELYLKQVLSLEPNNPDALRFFGVVAAQSAQYENAKAFFLATIKVAPEYAVAHSNLGNVYTKLRQFDQALGAYEEATRLDPQNAESWSNAGVAFFELKRFEEAIALYEKALAIDPNYAEALCNKGNALDELKRYEEAIGCYEQALSLNPNVDWAAGVWMYLKLKVSAWENLEGNIQVLLAKVAAGEKVSNPFPLLAMSDDPMIHRQASAIYAHDQFPANPALGLIPKHPKGEKIRIGYFSADFHNHATGYLLAELIELHDKNQFEFIGISFGLSQGDEMRTRLEKSFDQFIDASAMSDLEIAQLSRNLKIDIAVDLKGFTQNCRAGIFACRAAPIQVSYLGYPGTMSANYMDYLIADKTLIPKELQQAYSEKIAYLPNSYQVNDRKRTISDRDFTRAELGLPEQGFVFCSFNNNYKILPAIFEGWMRILKAVEGSVLWLYEDNAAAVHHLRQEAEKQGVNPSRLVFAKNMLLAEHLARHRLADLFIDAFPCNAHTTASDALWAGLPVLTLMGNSFASRVAASLLNAIGLPELITHTQEEYESLAIALGNNPEKLAALKQKLVNNRLTTRLFDTPQFTKDLEQAYVQMFERYQADQPPENIE
ncbi:tetratricopeptide repeat protein [Polynucleobacter sp. AP-Latsch-80-C2]|jgi:predicted O-linked N-acetylglucosamine transferase (SPINDLY family)|uniref:O-linked N-acetylglucosamine transferase, SPINDLY family protein n=1 Tax=Polynucleobacter sp. AP-Latsch-80-C2 TaxID=2576931 RepID=UPI001C0C9FE8|nr:tetratricopeptide repeat protein [Polynucleobacter sp. AP-Latsch-80-C2]MBU3623730.1 tetratricopeptide repeat protein [Polynucleobacter sp. AP-Latsch-80-C2]